MSASTPPRRAFSVSIFCRNQGGILLIRHKRLGTWLPVGGEIEPGETPLEAARRELHEETGLSGLFPMGGESGIDGTPPGFIAYEEHAAGSKGIHLNFAFVADVPTRTLRSCDEWSAAKWVETASDLDCPRNVRELVEVALRAPAAT